MTSRLGLIVILLATLAFSLNATATTANRAVFCGCSTLQGAEQFVLSHAYPGYHSVEVVNINTGKTWFITYEYFPRDYPKPTIDSAVVGTISDDALASAVITAEEKPIVLVITPKSPLFGLDPTMIDYQPERFWPILENEWFTDNAGLTEYKDDPILKILVTSISYYFGHGVMATIVFPDGSTTQVDFDPFLTNAIKLKKGAGRFSNGAYYPFSNGGVSNGSNYHTGIGLYQFMLRLGPPSYISEVCVTTPAMSYWVCAIKRF